MNIILQEKQDLQAITLKEEDELIAVRLTDGEDNVVLSN